MKLLHRATDDQGGGGASAAPSGASGGAMTALQVKHLLERPAGFYANGRRKAARFWCAAACVRLTGAALPPDCEPLVASCNC